GTADPAEDAVRDNERAEQTADIARITQPWIDAGTKVVVAGDFNARPRDAALDSIYALDHDGGWTGTGYYVESDQTDSTFFDCSSTSHCRSGASTVSAASSAKPSKRYDYIFYSKGENYDLHGAARRVGGSDHYAVRSTAT